MAMISSVLVSSIMLNISHERISCEEDIRCIKFFKIKRDDKSRTSSSSDKRQSLKIDEAKASQEQI